MFGVQNEYLGGFGTGAPDVGSVGEGGAHLELNTLQLLQKSTPDVHSRCMEEE